MSFFYMFYHGSVGLALVITNQTEKGVIIVLSVIFCKSCLLKGHTLPFQTSCYMDFKVIQIRKWFRTYFAKMPIRLIIGMINFAVTIHLDLCLAFVLAACLCASKLLISMSCFLMLFKISFSYELFTTLTTNKLSFLMNCHVQFELSFVAIPLPAMLASIKKHLS